MKRKIFTRTLGRGVLKFIEKFYKLVPKKKHKPKNHTMYDSVTVADIPLRAKYIAAYIDGLYVNLPTLKTRFPKAHFLTIAVSASHNAECLDVEKGDATISEAPEWVKRQHARGLKRPVVYTSVSSAEALIAELGRNNIPRSTYFLWTAHYTQKEHFCSAACGNGFHDRADATQYKSTTSPNLDTSICKPDFFP